MSFIFRSRWNFMWTKRRKIDRALLIIFSVTFVAFISFFIWEIVKIKSGSNKNIDKLQQVYTRYRFTYVAIIKERENKDYKCLGAIVNEQRIMTLAQCVLNHKNTSYEVIVGKYWLGKYEKNDERVFNVRSVLMHPQFKDTKALRHNYAILYTEFLPLGKSFCKTYLKAKHIPKGKAVVHGWNVFFNEREIKEPKEMQTTTFILSEGFCKEGNSVCEGILKPKFRKYCVGNLGSPIVQEKNKRPILIGFALTNGFPCYLKNSPPLMLRAFEFD